MGTVIDLGRERSRRRPARRAARGGSHAELELAIRRLTPLVREATAGGRDPELETELLAAIGAVSSGLHDEAMQRLQRLTERLGGAGSAHPSALPSRPARPRPGR